MEVFWVFKFFGMSLNTRLSKAQLKSLGWKVTEFTPLMYDPSMELFEIDATATGLWPQKAVLYCRPSFHQQFEFLQKRVIEESCLGWVTGGKGTGKSFTTFAFASSLPRGNWVVTWLHLFYLRYPSCVRLDGNLKLSQTICQSGDLSQVLNQVDVFDKSHFNYRWL